MRTHPEIEKELRTWFRGHDGVISREEALRLGASDALIYRRCVSGEWLRVHPGVYCAAAAPNTPYQDTRAAFVALAVAVVSHLSAGWIWDLLASPP